MKTLVALALVVWEPARFAAEALTVYSTLWYRGWIAGLELLAHGAVAAVTVTAGLALRNDAPHGPRFAQVAVIVAAVRSVQSLYWSALPGNTVPGDEPLYLGLTLGLAGAALLILCRGRSGKGRAE